ncbi:hypothetical protein BDR05DRAFT_847332, partial [Suillus weaverae]
LTDNHKVCTVGDLKVITHPTLQGHVNKKECKCARCSNDCTQYKYNKPYRCQKTAIEIMACILPKWHPSTEVQKNILDLTPDQDTANIKAIKDNGDILFD